MKVIYLAGPFRAATAWGIEQNVRRAETMALALWRLGVAVLCPHMNTRHFQGEGPDEMWIEGALELMRRCDGVFVLPGAEGSKGTQGEVEEARRCGIPVFRSPHELQARLAHVLREQVK